MEVAQALRVVFAILALVLIGFSGVNYYLQFRKERTRTQIRPVMPQPEKTPPEKRERKTQEKSQEKEPPLPVDLTVLASRSIGADTPPVKNRNNTPPDPEELESNELDQISQEEVVRKPDPTRSGSISAGSVPYLSSLNDLFIIRVKAPKDHPFEGTTLLRLFSANNLKAGKHKIFHLYDRSPADPVVNYRFSICSGRKPGTLEVDQMSKLKIPLLFLFFNRNEVSRPVYSFDAMMKFAQQCVDTLDATLYTYDKKILSKQRIRLLRTQAQSLYQDTLAQHSN